MIPERLLPTPLLPDAPATVEDLHGHPRFGTFRGELDEADPTRLRGPWSLPAPIRLVKHKRWVYALACTDEVLVAVAIVHLNYASNAFVAAYDLGARRLLFDDSVLGIPGARVSVNGHPGSGHEASFRQPGARFSCVRPRRSDRYRLEVELKRPLARRPAFELELELLTTGAPPAVSVVTPVADDGVVNVTQKRASMLATGTLRVQGRSWSIDGGLGGLDYTNGFLARHTAWRWGFLQGRLEDGTPIALNLVEGVNDVRPGCNENALWVGQELIPLDRARFTFDAASPQRPWRLETQDGAVKLEFRPLYVQKRVHDFKLVRSRFIQPIGVFSGTLQVSGRTLALRELSGVTEDNDSIW